MRSLTPPESAKVKLSSRSFFEGLLRTPFDGLIGLIFGWVDRGPDAIEHAAVLAAVKDATRR
jgi:hypothetical protein